MVSRYIRSNILGLVAIFLALGGVGYAAGLKKNAVKSKHIKDGQVMTVDMADNSVNGAKVADDTLAGADIDEASLDQAILQRRIGTGCNPGAAISAVAANGTVTCETDDVGGTPSGPAGGDLTGSYPNPTIANDAVGSAELANDAVGLSEMADDAVTSAEVTDNTLTGADISDAGGGSLRAADILEASLDPTVLQFRVAASCGANSAIRAILATGAVTCENSIPGPPTGAAGGDLSGTYPNPTLGTGAVQAGEIADGATLTEIADDDGPGSGLNADQLDGLNSTQLDATCPANYPNFVANLCFTNLRGESGTLPAMIEFCRTLAPGGRIPTYPETVALMKAGAAGSNVGDWTSSSVADDQTLFINSSDSNNADGTAANVDVHFARCVVQPVEAP